MRLLSSLVLLISLAFAHENNTTNVNLTVDLEYTKYQGIDEGNGISHWLGIRYAAPPLGDLRFRAPQDPVCNDTLQIANTHGGVCYSSPSTTLSKSQTEDCLFLDVYAPTAIGGHHGHQDHVGKPVFVWFQGGGFNSLANPNQNGSNLIMAGDYDLVFVTLNYRVGPYGFLASKEVQECGDVNAGLLDQRKVLEWVQKYIHLFGGDPNHVTIGGASAGAASVDLQLSAYGGRDDGLIHAAVAESQSFGAQLTVSESQYQYDGLVQRVGCNGTSDTLQCLRDTDIAVIATNNIFLPTPGGAGSPPLYMYSNVVDGTFTTDYTYKLYAEGKFLKVPVIFGDDTNEGTIFTPMNISNYAQMNAFLQDNFVNLNAAQLATIDFLYPKAQLFNGSGAYWRTAANAYGEMRYICPGIFISSAYPRYGVYESWNYHYNYLNASSTEAMEGFGVEHTSENDLIWGEGINPLIPILQGYWTSFIRSKNPNTFRNSAAPEWKIFNEKTMQRILFPNDPSQVVMEHVPLDQKLRCEYLSSIGVALSQ